MKKFFLLAGLCILLGCTSQLDFTYRVDLKNACDYPINVSVPKYTRYIVSEKNLSPNETIVVIAHSCLETGGFFTIRTSSWASNAMASCLQNDYRLTITAGDKERILDEQRLPYPDFGE
jgi:hypothetical protein